MDQSFCQDLKLGYVKHEEQSKGESEWNVWQHVFDCGKLWSFNSLYKRQRLQPTMRNIKNVVWLIGMERV